MTLNQRVQGSSPCTPTRDSNNLEQLLFAAPGNGNGLRTPCGPGKQLHVTGLRSTRWNDIAPAAQPLDRQIPHPAGRAAVGAAVPDGPDSRPTARDEPSRGFIEVFYGSDGFFRFLSLKCEHLSRVDPRPSPCSFMPCTLTSFLRTERIGGEPKATLVSSCRTRASRIGSGGTIAIRQNVECRGRQKQQVSRRAHRARDY